jgi:hypothetical protein
MAEKIPVRLVRLVCPPEGGVQPPELLVPSAKKYFVAVPPLPSPEICWRTEQGFCAGLSVLQYPDDELAAP